MKQRNQQMPHTKKDILEILIPVFIYIQWLKKEICIYSLSFEHTPSPTFDQNLIAICGIKRSALVYRVIINMFIIYNIDWN